MHYVAGVREKYLTSLRNLIRTKRAAGDFLAAEVDVQPHGPDGRPAGDILRIDLLAGTAEKPEPMMVHAEPVTGPLVGVLAVEGLEITLFPLGWHSCLIWLAHDEPDWTPIQEWFSQWRDMAGRTVDEEGLSGVVHFLSKPVPEGGGYCFEVDFGSAPLSAFTELLQAIWQMRPRNVRFGISDGTDLDPAIIAALESEDLSMARLCELTADLVRRDDGVTRVETTPEYEIRIAYANGASATMALDNLMLRLKRSEVPQRIRDYNMFIRGHREHAGMARTKPDLSALRPVIKCDQFISQFEKQTKGKFKPAGRRFVADLWIMLVWDSANGMQFASADEISTYELSEEEAFARAKRNYLESRNPPVVVEQKGPVTIVRTGDSYDPTLLLDDAFWQKQSVKGQVVACVPTRDQVLFTTMESESVSQLRAAATVIASRGDHLVSQTMLLWSKDHWEPLPAAVKSNEAPASAPPPPPPTNPVPDAGRKGSWWKFW